MLIDRDKAAQAAADIGISLDQIVEWQDLNKLQFANEVAQHIAKTLRALPPAGVTEAMVDRALDAYDELDHPESGWTKCDAMRAAIIAVMEV